MLGSGNEGTRERRNEDTSKPSFSSFLRYRIPTFLRRIAGMPDYSAYTDHLRRCHPETPVPSEREFYQEFVMNRYEDGPTRCC